MPVAAIYARVSSDKQREESTIGSQTAALIEFARSRGYQVPREWVFEDPLPRHLIASAPRELDQRCRLAANRALFPLLVRGHPCVDCRDRHCCSPLRQNDL